MKEIRVAGSSFTDLFLKDNVDVFDGGHECETVIPPKDPITIRNSIQVMDEALQVCDLSSCDVNILLKINQFHSFDQI